MISTESTVQPTSDDSMRTDGDVASECDFCGKAVHHETAPRERVRDSDGGVQMVTLCPECEFGID